MPVHLWKACISSPVPPLWCLARTHQRASIQRRVADTVSAANQLQLRQASRAAKTSLPS